MPAALALMLMPSCGYYLATYRIFEHCRRNLGKNFIKAGAIFAHSKKILGKNCGINK
jgi:hypothetical protein